MQYWIDQGSEDKNVVVMSDSSIFIGSCDKENYDRVNHQLLEQKSPIEVLGSDDLKVIPFSQIQSMISRSTDTSVDINYKAKKDIEELSIFFFNVEEKDGFVSASESFMPDHLEKIEYKQSTLVAIISPLLSLALSGLSIYLFLNKFRWLTVIVGGLWLLASVYMLISRVTAPPTIIRWSIAGRYFRKMWSGVKTGFSYAFLALIIAGVHSKFPDNYGEKSIYQQVKDDSLEISEITQLLERGADINYKNKQGESSLLIALSWYQDDLAIALIEAGADLSINNDQSPLKEAIYNDYDIRVIEKMLQKGASLEFDIEGMSPIEYSKQYENMAVVNLLAEYLGG